jgi:hypothetical protein
MLGGGLPLGDESPGANVPAQLPQLELGEAPAPRPGDRKDLSGPRRRVVERQSRRRVGDRAMKLRTSVAGLDHVVDGGN